MGRGGTQLGQKQGCQGHGGVLGAKGGNEVDAACGLGDNVNPCLSGQEEGMNDTMEWGTGRRFGVA